MSLLLEILAAALVIAVFAILRFAVESRRGGNAAGSSCALRAGHDCERVSGSAACPNRKT